MRPKNRDGTPWKARPFAPPLSAAEYVAFGVMPFQDFPLETRIILNSWAREPKSPPRWRPVCDGLVQVHSRMFFEWHARRGNDPFTGRPTIGAELRQTIAKRDSMRCGLCGGTIASMRDLHIDHIQPVSRGGSNLASNLQAAHASCNMTKGAKWGEP